MKGASVAGGIIDRANAAFDAGCDMVLVCNAPHDADELLGGLPLRSDEEMRILRARINRLIPQQPAMSWDILKEEPRYQKSRIVLEALDHSK